MDCPHCENTIHPPSDHWILSVPWSCSYCGGSYGIRACGQKTFPVPRELQPLAPLMTPSIARSFCFYAHKHYYVYALCFPTGLPFYVGMGQNNRCFAHEAESKVLDGKTRWSEKNDVIYQLLQTNETVWYHFLALVEERTRAAEIEAYWINRWGRRSTGGLLTNSVKPESTLEDCSHQPPEFDENEKSIIKSFQHPIHIVKPPLGGAPRSGAILYCPACGEAGQITAAMREAKILCSHCGHFVVPWTGEVGNSVVQFDYSSIGISKWTT